MRRIALFSDVHGNSVALDAVLADIDAAGLAGSTFCLGDLVGYGPDPSGVIERVRSRAIRTIRGNYDDGVGSRRGDCGCYYATDQARSDGTASYAFTDAALNADERAWLTRLPDQIRVEAEGLTMLLAHGSPRRINEYLLPDRSDGQLARLAAAADAELVCVGHVHIPYHRAIPLASVGSVHYVNSGSVGKPKDGDPRACWVEVVIGEEESVRRAAPADTAASRAGSGDVFVGAAFHRAEYDIDRVAREMEALGLPESLRDALRRA